MWTVDDFPGAENVPWPELIRARYEYEVDALVASLVARAVAQVAAPEIAERVARAAIEGAQFAGERVEAPAEKRLAMLSLVADWDGELCPVYPRWPRPHRDVLGEVGDPALTIVVERSLTLVSVAGSDQLQKALGEVLEQRGLAQHAA